MNLSDLSLFVPMDGGGFAAGLPKCACTFFGHRMNVHVETRDYENGTLSKGASDCLSLVRADLPDLISKAERALEQYEEKSDPDFRRYVRAPHIWIMGVESDVPLSWAVCVGRTDWEDYWWHINFVARTFQDVWGMS